MIKMLEQSMDELKRVKLDLPPPPAPNEKPQKPFGVFQEQNFEAKVSYLIWPLKANPSLQHRIEFTCISFQFQVGIRKQFTNSEKEVLQTVILKREQTAQETADSQLAMNGSNGHLSTGKFQSKGSNLLSVQFSCTFMIFSLT